MTGVAVLLQDPARWAGKNVGVVICGGNIDQRMLVSPIVREPGRQKRVVSLRFRTEDRPGVLGLISSALGEQKATIPEVPHQRNFLDVPARGAVLEIAIEIRGPNHADEVIVYMRKQPYIAKVSRLAAGE